MKSPVLVVEIIISFPFETTESIIGCIGCEPVLSQTQVVVLKT